MIVIVRLIVSATKRKCNSKNLCWLGTKYSWLRCLNMWTCAPWYNFWSNVAMPWSTMTSEKLLKRRLRPNSTSSTFWIRLSNWRERRLALTQPRFLLTIARDTKLGRSVMDARAIWSTNLTSKRCGSCHASIVSMLAASLNLRDSARSASMNSMLFSHSRSWGCRSQSAEAVRRVSVSQNSQMSTVSYRSVNSLWSGPSLWPISRCQPKSVWSQERTK